MLFEDLQLYKEKILQLMKMPCLELRVFESETQLRGGSYIIVHIPNVTYTIGRALNNDIILKSCHLSRYHAYIKCL